MNTLINHSKIQLVARWEDTGREVSRQQFDPSEMARVERIMLARNRGDGAGALSAGIRWGIETEVPAATPCLDVTAYTKTESLTAAGEPQEVAS